MKVPQLLIAVTTSAILLVGCQTDDIEPFDGGVPDVVLAVNSSNISENGGVLEITATISDVYTEQVQVTISTSGTAILGEDYTLDDSQIVIPVNSLSGTTTITAIQDQEEEGNETIELQISDAVGASFDAAQILSATIEDDDVAVQVQIIVNEILYDPSNSGLDGDANGDGSYSQAEDEFIEFINISTQEVDLSGYQIFDTSALSDGTPRHTIDSGTILPAGGVLVVFGGGTPTGSFGGAMVQTSTTGNMNLSNAGDIMTLTDPAGEVIVTFDIEPLSDNPNESYTRNPDITGSFEQHADNAPVLFSPGTKIDGTPF